MLDLDLSDEMVVGGEGLRSAPATAAAEFRVESEVVGLASSAPRQDELLEDAVAAGVLLKEALERRLRDRSFKKEGIPEEEARHHACGAVVGRGRLASCRRA